MRHSKIKQFILLLGLVLPTVWCGAIGINSSDGHSHINVKEANVQGAPKGSTIQAYVDGHNLTLTFTENLATQLLMPLPKWTLAKSPIQAQCLIVSRGSGILRLTKKTVGLKAVRTDVSASRPKN